MGVNLDHYSLIGQIEHVEMLLHTNRFSKEDLLGAALSAASTNNKEMINQFVPKFCDIDELVFAAVDDDRVSAFDCLQDMGGNFSADNLEGDTLLMHAALKYKQEYLYELIKHGACVNTCSVSGDTVLTRLCQEDDSYATIVKELLDLGADPNQTDIYGNTPLCLCACLGMCETANILIGYNADVRIADGEGETPLRIAESNQDGEMTLLLRDAEALLNWRFVQS